MNSSRLLYQPEQRAFIPIYLPPPASRAENALTWGKQLRGSGASRHEPVYCFFLVLEVCPVSPEEVGEGVEVVYGGAPDEVDGFPDSADVDEVVDADGKLVFLPGF